MRFERLTMSLSKDPTVGTPGFEKAAGYYFFPNNRAKKPGLLSS